MFIFNVPFSQNNKYPIYLHLANIWGLLNLQFRVSEYRSPDLRMVTKLFNLLGFRRVCKPAEGELKRCVCPSVCLYTSSNSKNAERISITFGIGGLQ
jgi:hypothetical protein